MSIYKVTCILGNKDLDSSDRPFQWATPVCKEAKDENGKAIKNPGSIYLYGTTKDMGLTSGKYAKLVVVSRGLGGLYNIVDPATATEMLADMGFDSIDDLPFIPLVESSSSSSTTNRAEARAKARAKREERNKAGMTAVISSEQQLDEIGVN